MTDEHQPRKGEREPTVQVKDRRRFRPDGSPFDGFDGPPGAAEDEPAGTGAPPAGPDPRDAQLAAQATRIDELTRAYASMVEEGKAARARMEREKSRVLEAERAEVAQVLLSALDELELALAAAGDGGGPVVDGVRITLASLAKKVSELGATRISVMGQPFDPHLAEAVDLVPVQDERDDDVVVQEVRAGYRIGDRVLRAARVRVGRLARS